MERFLLGGNRRLGGCVYDKNMRIMNLRRSTLTFLAAFCSTANGHATETCIWVMAVAIFVGMPRERE